MAATSGLFLLSIQALTKEHGSGATRVQALRAIDLDLAAGEFVAIMGTSGSGKSTLLHLIAGLDQPSSGRIHLGATELTALSEDQKTLLRRQQIGLVFQSFQLLDTFTAEENVALPLAIGGCPCGRAAARAARMLEVVGLEQRRHHRPHELSGGEQQRVAIARALVIEPLVLLADEPTGNLDSRQGDRIMQLLRQLVDERRQTLLLVTHDPRHAALADRVLHLSDGQLCTHPTSQSTSPFPFGNKVAA